MKFLFITNYYRQMLQTFYAQQQRILHDISYNELKQKILDALFAESDFYSAGVKTHGHEAEDIIVNDVYLQMHWAKEHGYTKYARLIPLLRISPYLTTLIKPQWLYSLLKAQIEEYQPEVLYLQNIEYFDPKFIAELKKKQKTIKLVIAQKASPITNIACFKNADLVFTSFPHFVNLFKKHNIKAEYLKLAFGERVLRVIPAQQQVYNSTFIGGLSNVHTKRIALCEVLAEKVDITFFGYGKKYLKHGSKIKKKHHGEVWGHAMYATMMQSKMTINYHIDAADNFANNMRLYEATGCGALLLTDEKINLSNLFEIGKEIITYDNANDLIDKMQYYSQHEKKRAEIAQAGQLRALKDHTFTIRMKEALDMLIRYL